MRNKFDQQLEQLHLELIKMGALCEEAISASVKAPAGRGPVHGGEVPLPGKRTSIRRSGTSRACA